jgi:hypothetical protein
MHRIPTFFLPFLPPDLQESAYVHLAQKCGRAVPAIAERVYSVSFERDGLIWTAIVGERLRGRRPQHTQHRRTEREIEDPAMVLAIFPDSPYCIITDVGGGTGSRYESPLFAMPINVVRFRSSTSS